MQPGLIRRMSGPGPGMPAHSRTLIAADGHVHRAATTWWFPAREPLALLWLQHGFARGRDRMADLAAHYSAAGYLVMTTSLRSVDPFGRAVAHLVDNTRFLARMADVLSGRDGALLESLRSTGVDVDMPRSLLMAGHSAGGDAVAFVAGRLTTEGSADLRGVVLLDPVTSVRGSNLATGLGALQRAHVPVRIVAAAPGRCNRRGSGVDTALQHMPGFAGIRLTTGSHADAEGANTDRLAVRLCGAPLPGNVAALRALSTGWLNEAATRKPVPSVNPDGSLVDELVGSGRGHVLWGHNGSVSTTR